MERFHFGTRTRDLIRMHAPANPVGVEFLDHPVFAADTSVYAYGIYRRLSSLFLIQGAK